MLNRVSFLIIIILGAGNGFISAQTLPAGFPVLEEALRRKQLLGEYDPNVSFLQRPIPIYSNKEQQGEAFESFQIGSDNLLELDKPKRKYIHLLPLLNTTTYNSSRPYGWGQGAMVPGVGLSNMVSAGIAGKFYFLQFQFRPEWIIGQNLPFEGFGDQFSDNITFDRFRYWNFGDHPERFSGSFNSFSTWGQSFLSLKLGPADLGVSNENIWWGPGQFNALIFSRNARGFEHAFLKTNKPLNIFIGHVEAQILFGRLESSGLAPSQTQILNERFFKPLSNEWRYLNALSVSLQLKWLPQFYIGMNRSFQQYNNDVGSTFGELVPVFEVFQKKKLFENDNSVVYDARAQDQQVSVFTRFVSTNAKFEVYFEFGKRDHNYNWREAILNPEHARAYIFGFSKLFPVGIQLQRHIQIRGEITHQQESVNRYIRYFKNDINTSWHTHYQVRGFTHYGESLGVGIGTGSNVQTLEVALVKKLNKVGILFERLENNQDFYYRAFGENGGRKPWVDLSVGFSVDRQWNRFILSSKMQLINGYNYQWLQEPNSAGEFSQVQNKLSIFANTNLIYHLNPTSSRKK